MAVFDSVGNVGEYEHLAIIVECKEPGKTAGISQLEIYLALEPHARLGIWTNGKEVVRVYKLPTAGKFKVVEGSNLPKRNENLILADEKSLTCDDLKTPSARTLKAVFKSLLEIVTSRDSKPTRREEQLGQMSNLLLLKLSSDHDGEWDHGEPLSFQLKDSPDETREEVNRLFAGTSGCIPRCSRKTKRMRSLWMRTRSRRPF